MPPRMPARAAEPPQARSPRTTRLSVEETGIDRDAVIGRPVGEAVAIVGIIEIRPELLHAGNQRSRDAGGRDHHHSGSANGAAMDPLLRGHTRVHQAKHERAGAQGRDADEFGMSHLASPWSNSVRGMMPLDGLETPHG